jgi:hypothetical protein
MSGKIDFIAFRVAALIVILVWSVYLTDSLLWGSLGALAGFILFNLLLHSYEKKRRPYTYNQLSFYLALIEKPVELVGELLPKDTQYTVDGNLILIPSREETIYVNFGFSPFGMNDIVKAVRAAKAKNSKLLTIVTTEVDRKIYTVIRRSDIEVDIIGIKTLMRLMIKKDLIPDIRNLPRHNGSFKDIFNRRTAVRLFQTAAIISLMSLIMPIKIYYLVLSSICATVGVFCLFNPSAKKRTRSLLCNGGGSNGEEMQNNS